MSDTNEIVDLTEADVIKRVLGEYRLDATDVLARLVHTLVDCHYDPVRRGLPGPRVAAPAEEGESALEAVQELLILAKRATEEHYEAHASGDKDADPAVTDHDYITGVIAGDWADQHTALLQILADCMALAEREMEQEEWERQIRADQTPHESPPPLRLAN